MSGEWRVVNGEPEEESGPDSTAPALTRHSPLATRHSSGHSPLATRHSSSPSSLATRHSPLATSSVVIRVRDTGVGISSELLPHVFDLFTQAERSLDRSQGGLGIGLALVKRLTELHGGTVEGHSTLGEGSEFVMRLPMMSADMPQAASPITENSHSTPRPLRVLVVDDSADTVLSFSILLETLGHHVRTARDGPTGVQAAVDYVPDVVFLDIGLPGLSGYEVAQRIRQEPTLEHAVLVALTGYGQETDRQASVDAGFNHHLVKPANIEQLKKILATNSPKN